jgi:hypothetical protein
MNNCRRGSINQSDNNSRDFDALILRGNVVVPNVGVPAPLPACLSDMNQAEIMFPDGLRYLWPGPLPHATLHSSQGRTRGSKKSGLLSNLNQVKITMARQEISPWVCGWGDGWFNQCTGMTQCATGACNRCVHLLKEKSAVKWIWDMFSIVTSWNVNLVAKKCM